VLSGPRTGSSPARPPSTDPARHPPRRAPRARLAAVPLRRLLLVLPVVALALLGTPSATAAPATTLWTWPLAGVPAVTRSFTPPPTPYAAGHRGVDLAGVPGQPVLAAGAGVVAFAGTVAGRPVVSVDHPGGLRTTYEPVVPAVAAGQAVGPGTTLGELAAGHAGCPAGACLHWGLRRGAVHLDPVRLLPWS
jgi:murein DD-endopeptidase MepM/ murein hydrolase activator NlpD